MDPYRVLLVDDEDIRVGMWKIDWAGLGLFKSTGAG